MKALTLVLLAALIGAPATADYAIPRCVLANGGGAAAGSANRMSITLGQPAIGPSAGGSFMVGTGFWYMPPGSPSGIEDEGVEVPLRFALDSGAGNPVRSVVSLTFAVPQRSRVAIDLYDVSGRRLRSLVDGIREPGHHHAALGAENLSTGIYFVRMRAGTFTETRRFVLIE